MKTRSVSLGKILVNGSSQTLYLFEKDKNGKSACSGACATNWPPLLTKGKPKASGGVKSSLLGTTKRSDGTTQVTYNKHPLYRFKGDANKVGATKGEGLDAFGAEWYVVGTNGKKIEKEGLLSSVRRRARTPAHATAGIARPRQPRGRSSAAPPPRRPPR